MHNQKVTVVGSGFSGLSAASFLAASGYDVTVLEKNSTAGGRARIFQSQGFTFDMGPSWYWMPDVFDKYFASFGKKVSDYYNLVRLDPSYRIFWDKGDFWDVPASFQALSQLFESVEKGSAKQLDTFLAQAAYKYEVGINKLVYKPGISLTEFMDFDLLKGVMKLDVFTSMHHHLRKFFKDPRLIQLMEFPVLFLGATAENTPALYSLMNYADMKLGTWYPMGGMHQIVKAMESLALELGVSFEFDTEVQSAEIGVDNRVKHLLTNKGKRDTNILVSAADYRHMDQEVLPLAWRTYSNAYWESRVMAPSCLIYYVGVNKKLINLRHHNLFFDQDFGRHAREIYESKEWPENPLFYVSCPSVTDTTVAPDGMENLFLLVPVAPGLQDTEAIRDHYYDLVMQRLEHITGQSIKEHVVFRRNYAHSDFINDYHSFKGNAYGLANTLKQTAILKPTIRSKKVKNLYYTGQLTVPGPGVPPSIISGKVVSDLILKQSF